MQQALRLRRGGMSLTGSIRYGNRYRQVLAAEVWCCGEVPDKGRDTTAHHVSIADMMFRGPDMK
jgi:hypothetical protein